MNSAIRRERDRRVLEALRTTSLVTIDDVLGVMDTIDLFLEEDDGIRWFNFLYRAVTREINERCRRGEWLNTAWVVCLDVEFAKLFFSAVESWISQPVLTPPAWQPLFKRRFDQRLSPIQFGLAGINAHINRDLPLAIVSAQERMINQPPLPQSLEAQDFIKVNEVLERVEAEALEQLATGWIKGVSRRLDSWDKRGAMAAIRVGRRQAWTHALRYWELAHTHPAKAEDYVKKLDGRAAFISRILLLPTCSKDEFSSIKPGS